MKRRYEKHSKHKRQEHPTGNSEAILSIFEDCWEECIRFSLPARLMEEFPATTYNLTYWEVSQQTYVQIFLPNLGVAIGQNSALTSYQIPSDTMNCLFPCNTFLPRTYYSFQVSQPAKICLKNRYFEERIHWVPLYRAKNLGAVPILSRQ